MNDDPIDLVGAIAPDTTPDPAALARVRSTLMATIDRADASASGDTIPLIPKRPRRRRRRRLLPIAAVAAVLAVSGGTAWAIAQRGSSDQTDNLSCPVPGEPDAESIVSVVTGDPIVDCAEEWRHLSDAPVPAMKAFDNGDGGVVVRLATDPAPDGATELPPGVYQNADIRRLENRIADVGTGIESGCYDTQTAKTMVEGYLQGLGMDDWSVRVVPTGLDAKGDCAMATGLDPASKTIGVESGSPDLSLGGDMKAFALEVHGIVEDRCLSTADAEAAIRQVADRTTVQVGDPAHPTTLHLGEPDMIRYQIADDANAECTTATVTVGGATVVDLIGPEK